MSYQSILSAVFLSLLLASASFGYADSATQELNHVEKATRTARPSYDTICLGSTAYFRLRSYKGSVNIQFRINPTGAKNAEGQAIPFVTLKTVVTDALNAWSSIDDTDIIFTVHPDSFPGMWSSPDGFSTITFENGPLWAEANIRSSSEADILLNPSNEWALPGQNRGKGDLLLFKTLAHEFGHVVGLDDLGNNCEAGCHHGDDADPLAARYNLMWHTGDTAIDSIETPQDGDKAGAVYSCPKPSGTLQFNEVWHSGMRITSDVTIPHGKTLEIEPYQVITFDSDVTLTVEGTLKTKLFDYYGAGFEGADTGTFWGGIRINPGGTLNAEGPVFIKNAKVGISLYDSNGILNGSNQIFISNCTNAGVHIYNCSPEINAVSVFFVTGGFGGILVEGSTSSPIIHNCEFQSSVKGIQLGSYSTANVYSCNIRHNAHQCIYLGEAANLFLDDPENTSEKVHWGNNSIVPVSGQLAIYNTDTNSSIKASNNYWGKVPKPEIFGYPADVVYDPYLLTPPTWFSTNKIIALNVEPSFSSAYRFEREGRWHDAVSMYESLLAAGNTQQKRRAIKSLIRIADRSDKKYDSIKLLVQNELEKTETQDFYRAELDQIRCELKLREGNPEAAIACFLENIEKYRDNSIKVDLLARLAVIYGNHGDRSKAKEYADEAADINPDQLALYSAYKAAGINYEDIFTGEFMNLDKHFKRLADMPTLRSVHTADVVNGKIYAIGGYGGSNNNEYLSTVEEYDPVADAWTQKADMPTARWGHPGGVVNGKIYAIGGYNGKPGETGCISTVEEYDPVTDTWKTKAPMPTARVYHTSCVVNGKIYVIGGGIGTDNIYRTVEEYDPETDTWTTKADMPTPRACFTCSALNGKIYAIGGVLDFPFKTLTGSVEEYDPATDTWTQKTDMPIARDFHAACAVDDKIYVMGGFVSNSYSISNTIEEYDPSTDTWTSKFPMPVARIEFPACTVNGKIYIMGGLTRAKNRYAEMYVYDPGCDIMPFVDDSKPVEYTLLQNYPNPFNPTTTISYQLDQPGMVNLIIYDILGRKVNTLVNEIKSPGSYSVTWNPKGLASGVYFYRVQFEGSKVLSRKMLLLK